MIAIKSDIQSVYYKDLGNRYYKKGRFSEALVEYNKALNYAKSKENQAIAYANRSAVYLELKKYERCLQNIQWALENEYPDEKVQKLMERKEKCEELMKKNTLTTQKDLKNLFKLSYPPNPKIPFIIDGLEIRNTKKFGRGIFTTRDLKPGDIISSEEPVLTSLALHEEYSRCCNCLTSKEKNLIPCLKTASLMFCSPQCRDEIYRKYKSENFEPLISDDIPCLYEKILYCYEDAFDGRDKLVKFIKENNFKKWKKTVFDYDFSDRNDPSYNLKALKSILSYFAPLDYEANKKCNSENAEKVAKGNAALKYLLMHMSVVWGTSVISTVHGFEIGSENPIQDFNRAREFGSQNYRFNLFSPLINYSCFPNIMRVVTDARIILYVARPIKAGEQLFREVSVCDFFNRPPEERRVQYRFNNCFYCQCYYCENGHTSDTLPIGDFPLPIDFESEISKVIQKVKEFWKIIEINEASSPIGTRQSFMACSINYMLMYHLGNLLNY